MLAGKNYTIEDYLRVLWRRKWVIIIPTILTSVATAIVALSLTNVYKADTLILVVPQRVPSDYVQPTVTTRIEDRLKTLNQQILSRTRLEQIIRDFDLYPEERRTGIMQDVVEKMVRDIGIDPPAKDQTSFRISYVGTNPRTVMQVTERLASLFIDENLRDRERLAEGTDDFLETELQDARKRLQDQERRLMEYRSQHSGSLPTQASSNLAAMQNAQMQVTSLVQFMAQDRDRRLMLERLVSDMESAPPIVANAPVVTANGTSAPVGATAAQQLDAARSVLAGLELRLTPNHPDIVKVKQTIVELEKKAEKEALSRPLNGEMATVAALNPAEAQRLSKIRDMRAEMESLDRQIAYKQQEERRLRGVIGDLQAKLAAVPQRESEMMELTRDYETLQDSYTGLLAKKENARRAVNMERRQIGEQFRVLDPPRLPERPIRPNRPQIYGMGIVGGIALGLGLVVLLEYRDTSLRTDADVLAVLSLPVLALVPMMATEAERQQTKRRQRVRAITVALVLLVLVVGAGAAWIFLR